MALEILASAGILRDADDEDAGRDKPFDMSGIRVDDADADASLEW